MPPYPSGPSREYPPRRTIIGGYVIDDDTCSAWASRITGNYYSPERARAACSVICCKLLKEYKTKFTGFGDDPHASDWMVVTQSAKFNGWKDMDPGLLPQFEEGYREEVARQLLEEQGVTKYTFKTVLH